MIDCQMWPSGVEASGWILHSFTEVSSAKRLDAPVTKLIDFSGIARSVFLDLRVYQLSCCRFIKVANFCEFDR